MQGPQLSRFVQAAVEALFLYTPFAAEIDRDAGTIAAALAAGLSVLLSVWLLTRLRPSTGRLRRQAAQDAWLARHDPLTRLPNRLGFTEQVAQALAADGSPLAVLLVDLTRFAEVNQVLGHGTGDQLLIQVAARLRATVDRAESVARIGGDVFALLVRTPDGAAVAQGAIDALRQPFLVEGLTVEIDARAGLACFPLHGRGADELLQRAGSALDVARRERRGIEVYRPGPDQQTPQRLGLYRDLRRALGAGELCLHYQPQLGLATGRVECAEALLRWHHPEHGLLHPDEFLPVAERTGLIGAVTGRVLDDALRQCRVWRDGGLTLRVAVNLSARNLLDPDLPGDVVRLLGLHGLTPDALELEVTEGGVAQDPSRTVQGLARLHAAGVRLAVDDHGAGESSLVRLRGLPVDTLKIDRALVSGGGWDEAAVHAAVSLGQALGLHVVAEGVDRATTLAALVDLGCDAAQGYHLSDPRPAADLPAAVSELQRAGVSRMVPAAARHLSTR